MFSEEKMRKNLSKCLITSSITLIMILAACTSSGDTSEFPTGRFVHKASQPVWAFEFDEDGTWRGYERDSEIISVSGKYATNGNLYTEMTHDWSNNPKIPATYFWTYDGENLTFELWGEEMLPPNLQLIYEKTYIRSE